MAAGLAAGYGFLGWIAGRYLYPAKDTAKSWLFVCETARLTRGAAIVFRTPAGATVNVTRRGQGESESDFLALSSTCPHLGCQVHWEPQNDRFFCPCHNGVFDPTGTPLEGPPKQSGLSLNQYPLKVERGILFIEVPTETLAKGDGEILDRCHEAAPGVDPCLFPVEHRPRRDIDGRCC